MFCFFSSLHKIINCKFGLQRVNLLLLVVAIVVVVTLSIAWNGWECDDNTTAPTRIKQLFLEVWYNSCLHLMGFHFIHISDCYSAPE